MFTNSYFLGIDLGSVSLNIALINEKGSIEHVLYERTHGRPIDSILVGLSHIKRVMKTSGNVRAVGVTGSGRRLASAIVGADVVKNEITAHAIAASSLEPDVQTVIEIGGQDSKIIIIREGVVTDFAMNTVCAAGTGSFLDQQALRLGIPIEQFSELALRSQKPVRIAGRCTVFAESDMIHKQQMGHSLPDIIAGLCEALVRNYLNNVARGKQIKAPVVFQGGVAANRGIHSFFEAALKTTVHIPQHHSVMGAIGAAMLARESQVESTKFRGFEITNVKYTARSFDCELCSNCCEIIQINMGEEKVAVWGDRCGRFSESTLQQRGVEPCLESVCGKS